LDGNNPYHFPAGPELDNAIHERCFGGIGEPLPYSSDPKAAEKVRGKIAALFGYSVSIGQTRLRHRRYYARLETGPSTATEVLAETTPLAICRLALLVSL
jgi:hypothetical protein